MSQSMDKLQSVRKAATFDELGEAHVKLILSGENVPTRKMAVNQAFYNASVLTRLLHLLATERVEKINYQ